jgi:hypothetical protein
VKLIVPYRHIHRADLHRGLWEAAHDVGCKVYLDSRVVSIDPSKPSLATKYGDTYEGDLIVASDGKTHPPASETLTDRLRTAFHGPRDRHGQTRTASPNRPNGISRHPTRQDLAGSPGTGRNYHGTEE